jgi:hypothetical protein
MSFWFIFDEQGSRKGTNQAMPPGRCARRGDDLSILAGCDPPPHQQGSDGRTHQFGRKGSDADHRPAVPAAAGQEQPAQDRNEIENSQPRPAAFAIAVWGLPDADAT